MLEKEEGFSEAATSLNDEKKVNFFHLGIKNNWKNLLNANVEKKLLKNLI